MNHSELSSGQIELFQRKGYVLVRDFCSKQEIERLYIAALTDDTLNKNTLELDDQSGKKTKLSLWFTPGDDVFGYLSRSKKMVTAAGRLLASDAPVCHFHSKLLQKEPKVGGAWEWHQDYGYWYKNQFMFPDQLVSVMVAINPAYKENGCLQVIKGSHKIGRLNHGFSGEQLGADRVMVNNALKTMELVYCEMNPGDALFFHSNLLHRSEANLSAEPRWSVISCYTSQSNLAYNENTTSWKTPVAIVPDEAILDWEPVSANENNFLKKENDPALRVTGWETKPKTA